MLDSAEYITIMSFDRSTILSQVWALDWSNFIIEIETYTSELKSKPLMPWHIGSATPEFSRKFNVLKEQ